MLGQMANSTYHAVWRGPDGIREEDGVEVAADVVAVVVEDGISVLVESDWVEVGTAVVAEDTVALGSVPKGTERKMSFCAPSVQPYRSV